MAKDIKRHITHLKSKVVESNAPKLITASDLYEGEIAVNYAKGYETLTIKNESGETVTFLPRPYNSARGGETIHPIYDGTGTAGGTNLSAAWSGTCEDIKTLYDGLTILYKIPSTSGYASGDTLSINGGEAHKVILNASTSLTTHYPVGAVLTLAYDSSVSGSFYTGSTTQKTTTGVWKIHNYDANTTYSAGTEASLRAGTSTTKCVWTPKVLKTGGDAIWQAKGDYVGTGRSVSTASGLTGGGDLSTDRTLGLEAVTVAGYSTSAITSNTVSYDTYGRVSSAAPIVYSATSISANQSDVTCPAAITGTTKTGAQAIVMYVNAGSSADYTVTISTSYKSPNGTQISLICPKNGYCEISYLNIGGVIYARGI